MMTIALGVVVGLVLGLTGAGGSIFAVPLLMWGMGWTLPQAAPLALLAVSAAAAFGTIVAWDVRLVRYRAAILMALCAWLLAPAGLRCAQWLDAQTLSLLFAVVLVIVAVRMLLQARNAPEETRVVRADAAEAICHLDPQTGRFDWTAASIAVISAIGALTGFLAGLIGVGGGFVIVPALRAVSDLSVHSAVATSLMAIALVSAGTVAVALLQGQAIEWSAAPWFIAGSLVGMLAGRRLARRIAGPALQRGFALCMVCVAAGMSADGLGWL
jgi:uncharacterized protein